MKQGTSRNTCSFIMQERQVSNMAVQRIDLSPERKIWEDAEFGEDVRGAGITSLQKTEDAINGTVNEVNQAAADVSNAAADVKQAAEDAAATVVRANETVDQSAQQANASAESAKTSRSWAVGGTGTRTGEDADNSRFYSLQSKSEAEKAAIAAAKAEQYADFVVPSIFVNFTTRNLEYTDTDDISFRINKQSGNLEYALL